MKTSYSFALGLVLGLLLVPAQALAGGLYLTDRGVRALGRGGAFVAGADDGQSLWYNPAGLKYAGDKHVLMDGTLTFFRGSFQRVTRDDVNGPSPTVEVDPMMLPIPTLALADSFGTEDFMFGFGVMAPNAVIMRWPEYAGTTASGDPRLGPTRHSLISMQGSAIVDIALGASWAGIEGLSLGLAVHVIPARFRAGMYLSACDYGALCQQPEQRDYEAPASLDLKYSITATPEVGLIYERGPVRVGASFMLFYDIKGKAKLETHLPNAPLFGPSDECSSNEARATNPRCARVVGDKADVKLSMPMIARLGLELRPTETVRLESAVAYEGWSRQKDFNINPQNIRIENAVGIPTYAVGPISFPRNMQDVWSLRFGAEYVPDGAGISLRAGLILENSAFPNSTLTPLTFDSRKAILALGSSLSLGGDFYLDFVYAHVFMADPKVRNSSVFPNNPLRPPLQADPNDPVGAPEAIGNGNYQMEADLIGGGLRFNL